jgi:hypothetical protein
MSLTTDVCPTPTVIPPSPGSSLRSPLEVAASVMRASYAHLPFTLASGCEEHEAAPGQPCFREGSICRERAFASARRAHGGAA